MGLQKLRGRRSPRRRHVVAKKRARPCQETRLRRTRRGPHADQGPLSIATRPPPRRDPYGRGGEDDGQNLPLGSDEEFDARSDEEGDREPFTPNSPQTPLPLPAEDVGSSFPFDGQAEDGLIFDRRSRLNPTTQASPGRRTSSCANRLRGMDPDYVYVEEDEISYSARKRARYPRKRGPRKIEFVSERYRRRRMFRCRLQSLMKKGHELSQLTKSHVLILVVDEDSGVHAMASEGPMLNMMENRHDQILGVVDRLCPLPLCPRHDQIINAQLTEPELKKKEEARREKLKEWRRRHGVAGGVPSSKIPRVLRPAPFPPPMRIDVPPPNPYPPYPLLPPPPLPIQPPTPPRRRQEVPYPRSTLPPSLPRRRQLLPPLFAPLAPTIPVGAPVPVPPRTQPRPLSEPSIPPSDDETDSRSSPNPAEPVPAPALAPVFEDFDGFFSWRSLNPEEDDFDDPLDPFQLEESGLDLKEGEASEGRFQRPPSFGGGFPF